MEQETEIRSALRSSERVVVKVGSRLLVDEDGHADMRRMLPLVQDLAALRKAGREVVLVSSGAIAMGMKVLGHAQRPKRLPDLQMAAAVGQTQLMAGYSLLFEQEDCHIGQVLLTHEDLNNRTRHLNARATMSAMLQAGIVPVVNENDAVSVDEIKLGDNDVLAALVAILVDADVLVLLTSVEGFLTDGGRVAWIDAITPELRAQAGGRGSMLSTGGMATKLEAAERVCQVGAAAVIADGREPGILGRIFAGEDVGTLVRQQALQDRPARKRKHWLAFFQRPQGCLEIDVGAETALLDKGTSLLPIGIVAVEGEFSRGSLLQIRSPRGTVVAQGLSDYSSGELQKIKGLASSEIESVLGARPYDAAIHRDNLVLLPVSS